MTLILSALRSGRRLQRFFVGSIAVLLLTSVPAFGIVYIGNWVVVHNKQTNGAPKAIIQKVAPGELNVNMRANNRRNSTSTVVVRRQFRVQSGGETISLTNSFQSVVRDGFVQVIARIIPNRGADKVYDYFFQNVNGSTTATFGKDTTLQRFLQAGKYTLEISIKYVNRKGFWDNTPPSGSPHRFTISSV